MRETEQELTISTPAVKKKNRNRIIKWMTPGETSELVKTNKPRKGKGEIFVLQSSRRAAAGIVPL